MIENRIKKGLGRGLSSLLGDTSKKINIGTSNSDYPTATAITNFEHEQEQQDIRGDGLCHMQRRHRWT